jgi:hypothetical protein
LLWSQKGVFALLDPELAARLKLSQEQREDVFDRILKRTQVDLETSEIAERLSHKAATAEYLGPPGTGQAERAVAHQASEEAKASVSQADLMVLDALTPSQIKYLLQLIDKPKPSRPAPKSKRAGHPG